MRAFPDKKAKVMKRIVYCFALGIAIATSLAGRASSENWMEGMQEGKPTFKSMNQLAFGPEGILFIADTRAASIVAIATGDQKPAAVTEALKIDNILQK